MTVYEWKIPHTDESDAAHEQAADAAAKEEEVHLCDCPLCDNATAAGCPNKGTVSIGETWMCPACANSVAAVQRVEGEEEKA